MLWLIIMDDEDEIGTIWFEKKNPDKLEIDLGIYLNRTDLFGKGIGRTLIRYGIDTFLSSNDTEELYLDVRKDNLRAIRCYEKSGFKAVQEGEKTTSYGIIKFLRMKYFERYRCVEKFSKKKREMAAESLFGKYIEISNETHQGLN